MARFDRDRSRAVPGHWPLTLSLSFALASCLVAVPASAAPQALACPTANCTASDLQVLNQQASAYAGNGNGTCTGPGDTIDIQVSHTLDTQGGSTKYDIGLYVNRDGGLLDDCWVDILETGNSSGSSNLGEQDACRDLDGDDQVTHSMIVTVPCVDDLPPFGELDPVTVWQSWANNDGQVTSCTHANVIEGTEAKCAVQLSVPGVNVPGSCGDGNVSGGEQCDDGNTTNGDGCSATCQLEDCGDGNLDAGEQCDDGNVLNNDGCSAACRNEVCGDGVVQSFLSESCDDGNTLDGDGCSARCQVEVPTVGEWGLGALGVLLLAAGALAVRRGGLI